LRQPCGNGGIAVHRRASLQARKVSQLLACLCKMKYDLFLSLRAYLDKEAQR
jgi:hypothetical protein